jgi:hypothetical protein
MRVNPRGQGRLFTEFDMSSVIDAQRNSALKEIERIEPNRLLNTPTDDLAGYIAEKFRLEVPVIDRAETVLEEPQETTVPTSDYGRLIEVRATAYTLTVPFIGDPNMLKVRPTTYDSMPPAATVFGSALVITVFSRSESGNEVKQELDSILASIERYLAWQKSSVDAFNEHLFGHAHSAIDGRKAKLLNDRNIAAGLGFKMRIRRDAATHAAPQVRRRIEPKLPPASGAPYKPEPVLEEIHYQHIIKVIENMALVMERSPTAFAEMGEEGIRQHFLVQLNGHFEGAATGETFNHDGKTDILIRVDGRNVFIAECKFWKGEKSLLQTIDQILSYLSWRDTKAAIVLFSRNKHFSEVLAKIEAAATCHPNRKLGPIAEGETRSRYVFGNSPDMSREIMLTILSFNVPS